MCGYPALRSRHRWRGIRHLADSGAKLVARILAGVALLMLAACAARPHSVAKPAEPLRAEQVPAQAQPSAAQQMIATANSMIGQPYRYGGGAPGGFDCSGLVVYAANSAGVRVPRTTAEQLAFGLPVPRAELQPGDLIFMHLSGKELHVAIALDAQLFVHAPARGGYVRVDSLIAPPYAQGFIGARRVVSSATPQ